MSIAEGPALRSSFEVGTLAKLVEAEILLVASDSSERGLLMRTLRERGYRVAVAETCSAALGELANSRPSLVVMALDSPHDSLSFLQSLKRQELPPPVLVIETAGRWRSADALLSHGAVDLLTRPIRPAELLEAVANAEELKRTSSTPHEPSPGPDRSGEIIASSPAMQQIISHVYRLSRMRCNVLVVGEPGSGRRTVAEAILRVGVSASEPLIQLDSTGTPVADMRSVLLGGHSSSKGDPPLSDQPLLGTCNRTILLRNADQLPRVRQDALAHLLEELEHTPADSATVSSHVRLLTTATPGITELLAEGGFRRDLYDRLAVVRLDVPPLRHRPQDVPLLASQLLKDACRQLGVPIKMYSRSALRLLSAMPWYGNAKELSSLSGRVAALVPRGVVWQEDVLKHLALERAHVRAARGSLRMARIHFERDLVTSVLQRHHGRIGEAARELGIERTNLYRKMRQLGIAVAGRGRWVSE